MDIVTETLAWINKTWVNKKCPYCDGNKFSIHPKAYELSEFTEDIMPFSKDIVPCIIVICKTCGNIALVSASKAGIKYGH